MSRVTYECDNGMRWIFLTNSSGEEVVDVFFPGFYVERFPIEVALNMLLAEEKRRVDGRNRRTRN